MSEYIRTVLSELQVATMGRVGCGAVSHARSREGGVRSERRVSVGWAIVLVLGARQEEFAPAQALRWWWRGKFEVRVVGLRMWGGCRKVGDKIADMLSDIIIFSLFYD